MAKSTQKITLNLQGDLEAAPTFTPKVKVSTGKKDSPDHRKSEFTLELPTPTLAGFLHAIETHGWQKVLDGFVASHVIEKQGEHRKELEREAKGLPPKKRRGVYAQLEAENDDDN